MRKSNFLIVPIVIVIGFSIVVICLTAFLSLKNTADMTRILEDSIKSGLISTSIAAQELIDVDAFDAYNSAEDIENDIVAYSETLANLRALRTQAGATYIYALKHIGGIYYFIFDTDEEDSTLFDAYALSPVHERAFLGEDSAGIMNVEDEYGNFNTGAVPIWRDGRIIGIICTDIADEYIQESRAASQRNQLILIASLIVTMGVLIVIAVVLLRNVRRMQAKLFRMANYDVLTSLPNRQYLLTYLESLSIKSLKHGETFAFLLVDLDNFKQVNDGSGHDAGDNLLRHFGQYLNTTHENSKAFRPPAGLLDVSARIGGDEFVQIVHNVGSEEDAASIAKKVVEGFRSGTDSKYIEKYNVGLSVGVALFPNHTDDFNVLIKYADIAMYNAKSSGKNTFCVFNSNLTKDEPIVQGGGDTERRHYRR